MQSFNKWFFDGRFLENIKEEENKPKEEKEEEKKPKKKRQKYVNNKVRIRR